MVGRFVADEGNAMGVVVQPSARETFTPRELAAAYKDFIESGTHYLDAETGIKAKAYLYGERMLFVYEETETGVVLLVHPTSQDEMSFNSVDARNPGGVERIAHAKYLRNGRLD
jgi:hypothetical protein